MVRPACAKISSVQPEQFTYPPLSEPLVEAYGGAFECVFVVLHPFVRVPAELAWSTTHRYPSDAEIAADGEKFPWTEVAACTSLKSCARINQALLTSIGSLDDHVADPAGRGELQRFLESQPIWMPTEGRFEPLLQPDFLHIFAEAEADELIFVPEFPNTDPVVRLPLAALRGETNLNPGSPFPLRGTLLASDPVSYTHLTLPTILLV